MVSTVPMMNNQTEKGVLTLKLDIAVQRNLVLKNAMLRIINGLSGLIVMIQLILVIMKIKKVSLQVSFVKIQQQFKRKKFQDLLDLMPL